MAAVILAASDLPLESLCLFKHGLVGEFLIVHDVLSMKEYGFGGGRG